MAQSYVGLTVEAFHKIDRALGIIDDIGTYVEDWLEENGGEYIVSYIAEHGLEVGYTVDDGDLSVTIG